MTVDDRNRLNLLRRLQIVLGDVEANTLMEHLPPVTWNHVATTAHVDAVGDRITAELLGRMDQLGAELRSEMTQLRTETRSEMSELRTELRSDMNDLGAGLRSQMNELRMETRSEMSELRTELRSDMNDLGAGLRIELANGFRRQTMWLGAIGTAWFGMAVSLLELIR